MTDSGNGLSTNRRTVLSVLGGIGGLGVLAGAGTRALLRDTERIPGSVLGTPFTGNRLELDATCDASTCSSETDQITFAFTDIDPPASGTTAICLHITGVPSWLWLRTSSPVTSDLGDYLTLTLTYGDGSPVTVGGDAVSGWSLNSTLDAFDQGQRLDGIGPDNAVPAGGGRCLVIEWSLPDVEAVYDESVDIDFTFAAVQHRPDTQPANPWNTTQ